MTAASLLRTVSAALGSADVPFMLTGSLAAAYHGAGRATMDIDLVIDPTASSLHALVRMLETSGLYVSRDAAAEAMTQRSMFNVIDTATGWKADLIIRKFRPFSESEFARRQPAAYEGSVLWVATVEDLVISKLEWARLGASARQVEDVASLLRIHGSALDQRYVARWIANLGLSEEWNRARA